MTPWLLVVRSLRFHWRANLGVLLGAVLATAILVGALAVGDSVRYSLRAMALARLGGTDLALNGGERLFRDALAGEIAGDLQAPVAPVLLLRGTGAVNGGEARVPRVQVAGVTEAFWKLGETRAPIGDSGDAVAVNQRLARKLGVKPGDELLLRVEQPSLLSRDAPLSKTEDDSLALRLPIAAVVGDAEFGRFSLEANQIPPYSAFVPLRRLQRELKQPGKANVLLVGAGERQPAAPARAAAALRKHFHLADAALELRAVPTGLELRTGRIFLDPPAADAALKAAPGARGVLTYFVNELRVGGRATPYSMVAALQGPPAPPDLRDDEILLNQWEAEDLGAKPGDTLRLKYFVAGPMRKLTEQRAEFRVRGVTPIAGAAADRSLMPAFPGVADAENCRDWKPGMPVDLKRIRDKDEAYWHAYRGTPKAFITLAAGRKLWNNRWGNLTAVRYPAGVTRKAVEQALLPAIDPAGLGLFFMPVRKQALAAGSQALDFGQLFLGFSFFLIAAALLLTALLFAFGAEQRAGETGLLLAVGFPPKLARRLLLMEGALLALIAAVAGGVTGVLYTQAVVGALGTVWRGAVADAALQYHAEPATLAMGAAAGFVVSLLSIWAVARKQAQAPARELLAEGADTNLRLLGGAPNRKLVGLRTALVCGVLGLTMVGMGLAGGREEAAETFFGAGAFLLIAGIAACRMIIAWLESRVGRRELTLSSLGMRNSVRRRARSLAAVTLLACGSFLVISIGASRHDPHEGALKRSSGTGGFALYGETSLPVYQDLNTSGAREAFGLDDQALAGASIVPLRLREGDDASCLNLNRAQTPRILGVDPAALASRKAFTFASVERQPPPALRTTAPPSLGGKGAGGLGPWDALDRQEPDGSVPAVGDTNTVTWALGKGQGDTVPLTDDRGAPVRLKIVGVLAGSILQGGLLISEQQFIRRFPSASGYRVFLVDSPPARTKAVSEELSRGLQDVGLDLTPAPERLAAFNSVENTYLSIFAVLGGLGLLLGSAGLGVIVLRNVLERRGELALMRAVGFRRGALQWLVFSEHSLLLALGIGVGVLAAIVAILPALASPGADVPYASLTATLAAVTASGFLWTWAAASLALRGPLMSALRSE